MGSLANRLVAWPAIAVAILAAGFGLYRADYLARFEHGLAETRGRLLAREVESDIVIVGIDAKSLGELNEWPWPRRHHARLLQLLHDADPARVFLDIDFSSVAPNPQDDQLLERALAQWRGTPVELAAHVQPERAQGDRPVARRPLLRFARHAREVSVVLDPGKDGLVREADSSARIDGQAVPAAFAAGFDLPEQARVRIDYSILPSSFGYVSYSDLLNGEVDLGALSGKTIFVGATAAELGDSIPVPLYQTLPGVIVQALAAETVRAGTPTVLSDSVVGVVLTLWAALFAIVFGALPWRRNLLIGAIATGTVVATTVYLYAGHRLDVPAVPFILVLGALFIGAALKSLEYQTWRALAYAIRYRRRDALLKSIVESSSDCILSTDHRGNIRTANHAASRLFAAPQRTLLGARISNFIPDLGENPVDVFAGYVGEISEHVAVGSNGRSFPVEVSVSRVAIENEQLYTAIIRDITERKAQRLQLEHQATHDPLTQLPNRAAVMAYLDGLLRDPPQDQRLAVLMLDLCRFKEVNDTLGHDVGDEVLREVARRFSTALPAPGYIGRIGGDEFTMIVPEVSRRIALDDLSERLVECLRNPIRVRGIAIEVGLSIGIALWPEHAGDAQELLRHSDIAMYAAKHRRTAYEYYAREDDQHTVRRLSMVSDLRSAISSGEIRLLYQPQIDLKTGAVAGVEALMRWQHPVHGTISPAEFISIAESTDIIRPLTDWTIAEVLRQIESWDREGLHFRVAVNLSARTLQDADFPSRVLRLLEQRAIEPGRLELEITETAMMLDPDRARDVVRRLHALGLRIAIDDYGSGFSSLGYLRDLRVHALKLDKSFVIDLETHEHNRVIVESTARMAEALGLETVAEGVESEWVSLYLAEVGYRVGQGFWFARPMTAADCKAFATSPAATQRVRIDKLKAAARDLPFGDGMRVAR